MKSMSKLTICFGTQLMYFLVLILANVVAGNEVADIFDNTKCPPQKKLCKCQNAVVYDSDVT